MTGPQRNLARFLLVSERHFDKLLHDTRDLYGVTCVRLGNVDREACFSSVDNVHGSIILVKELRVEAEALFRFVVDTAPSNRYDAADRRLKTNSKRLRYFSFSRRHLPLAEKLTQD